MENQEIEQLANEMLRAGWRVPMSGEAATMGELYTTHDRALVACVEAWLTPYGEPTEPMPSYGEMLRIAELVQARQTRREP
jgi:hypothetical protein